ncbi:unnamed protein product [Microthlaspi erraticum]|uniref:F-box associated beta-propeller type 1 domain-containing protein n=1 Tax=Microthlaspi erraticum TaxID=1685480 RepID=A0A6D2I6J4_9BRAS|nr:unnamed protein product [Microthlaspi erraticum]CAA7027380.1 unnamed protein product [Microthlaspi erraticum]
MARTRMCDLPEKLIGEKILTRVPITSLGEVRSTCKSWDALTKRWILGNEATSKEQFLGFMTMNSKVCSLSFQLKHKGEVDLSIKQVNTLDQVEISQVFHCDGLLLCVPKDMSKLVVWNPYLCQTRWIEPRTKLSGFDRYALGYDVNRNHKILRFLQADTVGREKYELYTFSSSSWRVLDITRDWGMEHYSGRGVSVKGNAYFYTHENSRHEDAFGFEIQETQDFLHCFDFTREKFGPLMPLPFHSGMSVTLSCVRDEQLAVLSYNQEDEFCGSVEIWVTTRVEPNSVSWSKFLRVERVGVELDAYDGGSFFIDEQEKVAVVFACYRTAFILREDGYHKSLSLGEASILVKRSRSGYPLRETARVCSSSYRPSLVQV